MAKAVREPPEDLDTGPEADPESVARSICLRKLADRPRSRHELEQALAAKDVPAAVASRLLDRFSEVGLVDDRAFARAWAESRLTGKGLAPRAIAIELRRKGVAGEVIDEVLAGVDSDDEEAVARRLVQRKLRSMRSLDQQVALRRLVGMLGRKGFSPGLSYAVVKDELGTSDVSVGPLD